MLLVEEDGYVAWGLKVYFEGEGFRVELARSIADALELLLAKGDRFDLVVADGSLSPSAARSAIGDGSGSIVDFTFDERASVFYTGRVVEPEERFDIEAEDWEAFATTLLPVFDEMLRPLGVVSISSPLLGGAEGDEANLPLSEELARIAIQSREAFVDLAAL